MIDISVLVRLTAIASVSLIFTDPTFAAPPCQPTDFFCVVHTFKNGADPKFPNDGEYPEGDLTAGLDGTLYGSTFGASSGSMPGKHCSKSCGTSDGFRIGGEEQTAGYSFTAGNDGAFPTGEVLLVDTGQGYLYGATHVGGGLLGTTSDGGCKCGTIYRIKLDVGPAGRASRSRKLATK